MKLLLGLAAVAVVACAMLASPAQARCRLGAHSVHCVRQAPHQLAIDRNGTRFPSPSWGE